MLSLNRKTGLARGSKRAGDRVRAGVLAAGVWLLPALALAQRPAYNRHFPLDQNTPPGMAGQWSTASRRAAACGPQWIRVELPGDAGQVAFYTQPDGTATTLPAPAVAAVDLGAVYRLRIGGMPELPGVELYPTVELLDRLHPPRGRETEFPIPITFTEQEIQYALQGRMVTKVIYLEQPNRAAPVRNTNAARTRVADPRENVLAAADEAGRPMAIVRLGARVPDPRTPEPGFFGAGAPVQFLPTPARAEESRP